METNSRERLVNNYFADLPAKPDTRSNAFYLILGLLSAIIGISAGTAETYGMVLLIGGLVIAFIQALSIQSKNKAYKDAFEAVNNKATDEQLDAWFIQDLKMIREQAYIRLNIEPEDASADPLTMDGPAKGARFAAGADKVLRFSQHEVTLFFLTMHNVAIFKCILNLAKEKLSEEVTKEFPYKDITNLETVTINDKEQLVSGKKMAVKGEQMFSLYTSGGNNISVQYYFSKKFEENTDFMLPMSEGENTIKAIRKRLQEYKDRFLVGRV